MLTRSVCHQLAWAVSALAFCLLPLSSLGTTVAADDALAPPTLVRPADGAAVPGSRGGGEVALAWQPSKLQGVLYFVQVMASQSDEPREVFAAYTKQTELRVRLDDAGQYRWRVLNVSRATAHYSVSPWSSFSVGSLPR